MATQTTVTNDGGGNLILTERWSNATQPTDPAPAGYWQIDASGAILAARALTSSETAMLASLDATQGANQATLRTQAQAALAGNRTYLGLASPSNVQVAVQVKALTQQIQALIRLALSQFDATS
jgi:hypothetical protein